MATTRRHRRAALLALAVGWPGIARAETPDAAVGCPVPFTEYDVRAISSESKRAVFRDDAVSHKRLFTDLVRQVPCLDHQLSKDAWAVLLLDEAIVRNVAKADWQGVLTTAMSIFSDLEAPQYMLDAWERGAKQVYGEGVIPPDATLFVDGVLQSRIPLLTGEHIVQVWRDNRWRSVFLDGVTPFPSDWLAPKPKEVVYVEAPDESWQPTGRGSVGVEFGVLVSNQLIDEPGTYLADAGRVGGSAGIAAHGVQTFGAVVGAFYDARLRLVVPSVLQFAGTPAFDAAPLVLPSGYLGPSLILERVHAGIGGGVFQTQKVEQGIPDTLTLPQVHLAVGARQGRGAFDVGGGLSPTAAHASMSGGWILTKVAPLSWRLAADATLEALWLSEEEPGTRHATVLQVAGVARLEAVWGADR